MAEGFGTADNPQGANAALIHKDPVAVRESKATVWSAVIAAISLIALVTSIIISFRVTGEQTALTQQQNTDARQQELVTLVTDIEQAQQASGTIDGQSISSQLAQTGEAEEADVLIGSFPSADVSSVERYIVGIGLEGGDDYQSALTLFTAAAQQKSDPRTSADAWRAAADVNYKLGFNPQAENDIGLAKQAFDGPDTRPFNRNTNQAFTDLFDIPYRAPLDCSVALSEWSDAAGLFGNDSNVLSGANAIANEQSAAKALATTCHVPASVLKEIQIKSTPAESGSPS
jgi:hypothetical protein